MNLTPAVIYILARLSCQLNIGGCLCCGRQQPWTDQNWGLECGAQEVPPPESRTLGQGHRVKTRDSYWASTVLSWGCQDSRPGVACWVPKGFHTVFQ